MYIRRHIDQLLSEYIKIAPAILIEGAKGVGKTKTCEEHANTVFYLDDISHKEMITLNNQIITMEKPPVLIDEWQKYIPIWDYIRRQVDNDLRNGSIIITGSSTNITNKIHSGAGRIISFKMRPFTIEERNMADEYIRISDLITGSIESVSGRTNKNIDDYLDEIFRSGFPGIAKRDEKMRRKLLSGYIDNIIYKDFEENGFKTNKPELLRSWLKAYAAAIATTANYQTIIDAAMSNFLESPNRKTADKYHSILSTLGIIEELDSWLGLGKTYNNIAKTPKHFLVDPSLLVPLLGINKEKILNNISIYKSNKTILGRLFEAFIYQSLITYCEVNELKLSHLRLNRYDREIDFIIEDEFNSIIIAIEVKSAKNINDDDVRHLNWLEKQISDRYKVVKVVICMAEFAFTRSDKVHIIPAAMLGI